MKYFGTDGIRGVYGELINEKFFYEIGRALIKLNNDTLVIATDTRFSKDVLANAVIDGFVSVGGRVIDYKVLSSPGLIYYSKKKNCTGVMITASHNGYKDNGIKILNKGYKLTNEEEQIIEGSLGEIAICKNGTINTSEKKEYLNFLDRYNYKNKYKVAIDCANGSACSCISILKDVLITSNNPDGYNINYLCGSTYLDNIIEFVKSNNCDLGFAFDGDADRVIAVEDGIIYDGDKIGYIISKYMFENNILNDNTVVISEMSNIGLLKKYDELNIKYILTPVGDKNLIKELKGYSIGFENSGHIILNDIHQTGDGILVMLYLLMIMNEEDKKLKELCDLDFYVDKMINLSIYKDILKESNIINKIHNLSRKLIDGKIIVRPSGTEDLVRVTVMAKELNEVDHYLNCIIDILGGCNENK